MRLDSICVFVSRSPVPYYAAPPVVTVCVPYRLCRWPWDRILNSPFLAPKSIAIVLAVTLIPVASTATATTLPLTDIIIIHTRTHTRIRIRTLMAAHTRAVGITVSPALRPLRRS